MMRSMRASAKYIFYVLAVAFIVWLVVGQVTEILGGARDVVLKVDGQDVRLQQFQAVFQSALEEQRRQGAGRLSREEEQRIQNQVADQLIQAILLQREYRRLGIRVSDDELRQAARSSPPPQILRQVAEDATFQTNGQFDITKWQRYLSSAPEEFRAQVEALYREYIPQRKLEEYLTADVYVSDGKLWRIWRDQHESVTVAVLAVMADRMPDSLAPVTNAELERHYAAHKDAYKRPSIAWLSFVAVPRVPDAADSAAALAKARELRTQIAGGKVKFEDAAKRESADSASGARGGDLGWVKRNEPAFDPEFLAAMRRLHQSELSQPVLSSFGYHLIRVEAARGDSMHVRHILIAIVPQGKHLELVEARADTLDKLAAEQTDGGRLDSAAHVLSLPLVRAPKLVEGDRLRLGRYVIPDVSVWAFEARAGETSPVIEAAAAYYVFRLDSLFPAGLPPLAQVRDRVLAAARYDKKKDVARKRADQAYSEVAQAADLPAAGRAKGLPVEALGPFTRLNPPGELARDPLVIGAAFGLRPGEKSGVLAGQTGFFILQGIARKPADSTAWLAQRDQQREAMLRNAGQARVQQYLSALRAQGKVVDRRKEIFRPGASSGS